MEKLQIFSSRPIFLNVYLFLLLWHGIWHYFILILCVAMLCSLPLCLCFPLTTSTSFQSLSTLLTIIQMFDDNLVFVTEVDGDYGRAMERIKSLICSFTFSRIIYESFRNGVPKLNRSCHEELRKKICNFWHDSKLVKILAYSRVVYLKTIALHWFPISKKEKDINKRFRNRINIQHFLQMVARSGSLLENLKSFNINILWPCEKWHLLIC